MRVRTLAWTLFVASVLLPVTTSSQENVSGTFSYPPPFDKFGLGILSEPYRLALSNQGRMLYRSQHAAAKALVKFAGGDPNAVVGAGLASAPFSPVQEAPPVSSSCGSLTNGAKFNLEPIAGDPLVNVNAPALGDAVVQPLPRDGESVDFLYGGGGNGGDFLVGGSNDLRGAFGGMGGSLTLTAFHTKNLVTGTFDCTVEVEAATPDVVDVNGNTVSGFGDPVIAADNTRSEVFAADLHMGATPFFSFDTAIGLFRTTPAGVNASGCLGAAEGKAKNAKCWPAGIVLNASSRSLNDNPHMTVDERSSGTGAGDVYVTWVEFVQPNGPFNIDLMACKNGFLTLADCSSIVQVVSDSSFPPFPQLPNVAVRPANASSSPGEITVTYVEATPVNFVVTPVTVPVTETMAIIDVCISNRHYGRKKGGRSEAATKERRSPGRF